jgi:hypothetical protein
MIEVESLFKKRISAGLTRLSFGQQFPMLVPSETMQKLNTPRDKLLVKSGNIKIWIE